MTGTASAIAPNFNAHPQLWSGWEGARVSAKFLDTGRRRPMMQYVVREISYVCTFTFSYPSVFLNTFSSEDEFFLVRPQPWRDSAQWHLSVRWHVTSKSSCTTAEQRNMRTHFGVWIHFVVGRVSEEVLTIFTMATSHPPTGRASGIAHSEWWWWRPLVAVLVVMRWQRTCSICNFPLFLLLEKEKRIREERVRERWRGKAKRESLFSFGKWFSEGDLFWLILMAISVRVDHQ